MKEKIHVYIGIYILTYKQNTDRENLRRTTVRMRNIHIYTYTYIHTYIHTQTKYRQKEARTHISTHAEHIYIYTYTHTYTYTYTYIHTYIHTQTERSRDAYWRACRALHIPHRVAQQVRVPNLYARELCRARYCVCGRISRCDILP